MLRLGVVHSQQSVELRPPTRFCPVRDVELAVDVRQVELHRLLGHPEHLGELRIRMPLGDEPEDLELTPRQLLDRTRLPRRRGGTHIADAWKIDRRVEDAADHRCEIVRIRRLYDIRERTGPERALDAGVLRAKGQDDRLQRR